MDSRWTLDKVRDGGRFGPDSIHAAAGDGTESAPTRFGPYKQVHRLLRGRYHLLLPGVLIALAIGGAYGWRKATPDPCVLRCNVTIVSTG